MCQCPDMIPGIGTSFTYWNNCTGVFAICFMHTKPDRGQLMQIFLLSPTTFTGHPGRPRYTITREQISHCVFIGMTWQRIALRFGINRRTLHRHKELLGIEPLRYAVMLNQEVDSLVTVILQNTPNAGETYVLGSLRSCDLRIQRWRVRDCIKWIPLII